MVEVSNPTTNKTERARALLDCGSQSSFMTQSLKDKLCLSGPIELNNLNNIVNIQCHHSLSSSDIVEKDFNQQISRFWDLEEIPLKSTLSHEERLCEKHFITHTERLTTGRFSVRLPLKDSPNCLGESYTLAKKRFHLLEKRFRKHPQLKLEYVKFIKEYEQLGHLSQSDILRPDLSYFLCHHAVFKENSESTKIRVVFDGSAATSSGLSINDILMVGQNLQDSLFSILVRARQHKYLLTGDVEKMYRMVELNDKDRNLQLILWRDDESLPIKTMKLNTVTYGMASSSYLSTRCLWQLGEDYPDVIIKNVIQHDFYVDDMITSSDSEQELKHILNGVTAALRLGCFNLRKLKSNLKTLFDSSSINTDDKLTLSESSSTLGLGWDPSTDTLHFPIHSSLLSKNNNPTKRSILSNLFKIFDPLGLLSPCVVQTKIILQQLWLEKLGWDDHIPEEISKAWDKFSESLSALMAIKIPRHVLCDEPTSIELHSFCDASQSAYGACVYARSINSGNIVTVRLLCAKSKIAPTKPTTIPRLELCAALLASRLCKAVRDALRNIQINMTDLSKDAFIMTFRRFVARRGRPTEVFCDNGRNFVAGAKELNNFLNMNADALSDFASGEGIKFIFSPSYAPHFGGIWEAGVKSAKYHLKRVMGNSHLTFEELSTLFAQVESILNSRPLYPMSSTPDDLLCLTPGHFLIGRALTAIPSPSLEDHNIDNLRRYQRIQHLHQHFWRRWQREYIAELQQRCKWKVDNTSLNIGDLVLLKEDNSPPLCWRLGRVTRLFPGSDGISRVADVKTQRGVVRRPLVRLCPLPSADKLDM
ncbi:uncharacterized protein LOC126056575 [Helicoverpa armigera]|uniref:uncharacterized protein LOC126056575 n=1 Tax=Helicoverpa armigera TaxID=29058 RepID=UPI0030832CDC